MLAKLDCLTLTLAFWRSQAKNSQNMQRYSVRTLSHLAKFGKRLRLCQPDAADGGVAEDDLCTAAHGCARLYRPRARRCDDPNVPNVPSGRRDLLIGYPCTTLKAKEN